MGYDHSGSEGMDRTVPPELRRERILSLVREREFVRVGDLSDMFGISEVTVRADLDLRAGGRTSSR